MEDFELTEKEIKVLKHQFKLPKHYLFILAVVLLSALVFFVGTKYYLQPSLASLVTSLVSPDPELQKLILDFMHLNSGFYAKAAGYFFFLLVGLLAGLFYSQKQLNKILKKVFSNKL